MTAKGIILQAGILVIAIGLFGLLLSLPKNYSVAKLKNEAQQEEKVAIKNDIDEVKKGMEKKDLAIITNFENRFSGSSGTEKIQWLDSIIRFWDNNMRPAISAVYAKDKADL